MEKEQQPKKIKNELTGVIYTRENLKRDVATVIQNQITINQFLEENLLPTSSSMPPDQLNFFKKMLQSLESSLKKISTKSFKNSQDSNFQKKKKILEEKSTTTESLKKIIVNPPKTVQIEIEKSKLFIGEGNSYPSFIAMKDEENYLIARYMIGFCIISNNGILKYMKKNEGKKKFKNFKKF